MSTLAAGMTAVIMVAAAVAEAAADPGADAAEIADLDAADRGGRRSAVGRKVKGESVCSPFFTRGRRLIFQLKSLAAVD